MISFLLTFLVDNLVTMFCLLVKIAFGLNLLVGKHPSWAIKDRFLIKGGNPADGRNRYPYYALLTITPKQSDDEPYLCGGTLIHSDIVITAAQCYHNDADVSIRINSSNMNDGIERTGDLMIPHEDYANSFSFDIMIVKLNQLILSSDVTPIKLHQSSINDTMPLTENEKLTVMGFGAQSEFDETPSDVLREVDIDIGDFNDCNRQYKFNLDEKSHICTIDRTGGGKDSCSSDGGGPLIKKRDSNDDEDLLIGITSFGAGCGRSQSFSGYTKVSPLYNDWIDDKICEHSVFKPSSCRFVGGICFPGDALVDVFGKGSVQLSSIEIGDKVLAGNGDYEEVYTFGHYSPVGLSSFLELSTTTSTLRLSRDHMVFVSSNHAVPASMLQVGDKLLDVNGNKNRIVSIKSILSKAGAFAPFTASGSIVVNGIVASNYISYQESDYFKIKGVSTPFSYQWIAHTFNSMHRLMVISGISNYETTYTSDGISHWVHIPHKIFSWALNHQYNAFLSTLFITLALLSVSVTRGVEIIILSPRVLTPLLVLMSLLLLLSVSDKKAKKRLTTLQAN